MRYYFFDNPSDPEQSGRRRRLVRPPPSSVEEVEEAIEASKEEKRKKPRKRKPKEKIKLVLPDEERVISLVIDVTNKLLENEELRERLLSRARGEESRSERRRDVFKTLRGPAYKSYAELQEIYRPFIEAPVRRFFYNHGEGQTARQLHKAGRAKEAVDEIISDVLIAFLRALAKGTFLLERETASHTGEYYDADIADIPTRIRTWLYGVAHNKTHDFFTRLFRESRELVAEEAQLDEADDDEIGGGSGSSFREEESEQFFRLEEEERSRLLSAASIKQARTIRDSGLQEALAALPEPERTVFKLRVLGRTYQEIADQTGLPRGTVGRVIKEVREEIEKEIGLQLTLDVSDVTQGTTKTLVGTEAQNQLLKDLLSLATPAEKKQLFAATREGIQEAAKKKIENAFIRLGTSYEEFSGMPRGQQAKILGQLGTQGVTSEDGAHASGNIQESEVMAQLRNAVIDAVRRGKRGRPPRKNDGGISALIYQLLGRLSWAWV